MASELIFITGGVRSGKSHFALEEATRLAGNYGTVTFIATAGQPGADVDLAERIDRHRKARPPGWITIESDLDLAAAVRRAAASDVILIDCLTQWTSRLMAELGNPDALDFRDKSEATAQPALDALIARIDETPATFVIVSNEVGSGVAPPTRLGNVFADILGTTNRHVATRATRAFLLAAGIPLRLK